MFEALTDSEKMFVEKKLNSPQGKNMIEEVLVSPLGWAVIICPKCWAKSHVKPKKELQHKVLERTCICGAKHQLIFDTRSEHRKKCSFEGIILAEKDIPIVFKNISEIGAFFEGDKFNLVIGSFYKIKIRISDNWIEVLAKIIRVKNKIAGIEFVNLNDNQKKIIEAYLLSD